MEKINLTFPDGSVKEFNKGVTPFQVAESISSRLAGDALISSVNGVQRDLYYAINEDSKIAIYTFNNKEGQEAYWHSTSHLMAHAIQVLYPEAKFGVGPAVEGGFYYDIDINETLTETDLEKIEKKMMELAEANSGYERQELTQKEALELFEKKGDQYKIELISDLDDKEVAISLYHEGDFTDLCRGPHIPGTGRIKYVKLLSISGSYWRGDEKNKSLQRIYGVSFPKKKMLEEHLELLEEAKKRDHRKLGKELDLFTVQEEAGAGLIYWHPKGARVRHEIEDFWRKEHLRSGYELLYTPHIGKSWLWETSGHLVNFAENMYAPMQIDDQNYYLKPMNCPFHIMIYKANLYSYRDLPKRWAELGTVYRYEKSGALHGMLRVRGFTQDDAHIFCTAEQMDAEIKRTVHFSIHMLKSFGFDDLKFYVATRPDKAIGDDVVWEQAVTSLKSALESEKLDYEVDEGGGAFYGPKIDIKIKDALKREWQLSTIQFDFNLPERFDMKYIGEDGKEHRPYMVHRALLGSIERFMGILVEHYGGSFPTWIAPVQVAVVPVSEKYFEYAEKIKDELLADDIRVELDYRNEKVGYKIRAWETQKVPYMLIVGEKEVEAGTVSVREHKVGDKGSMKLEEFVKIVSEEIKSRVNNK
ncbi:MAG: threonine--tRNA ligase [Bacteroidetes bacterium]|nr:threonine--tRNA ligase [Bacteroidota bacterium]